MLIQKLRNRERGFTLIELLIVIAIIGIIAALILPNLLDALQKSKQKRSMADLRTVGTAFMQWVTDAASAAAAGQQTAQFTWGQCNLGNCNNHPGFTPIQNINTDLAPVLQNQNGVFYIQTIPENDAWDNLYEGQIVTAFDTDPGTLFFQDIVQLRSLGRGGQQETGVYTGAFNATDYEQDLVWANGLFVSFPSGIEMGTATP